MIIKNKKEERGKDVWRVSGRASERASRWLGAANGQVAVGLIVLLSHSVPQPVDRQTRSVPVDILFPYYCTTLYRTDTPISISFLPSNIDTRKKNLSSKGLGTVPHHPCKSFPPLPPTALVNPMLSIRPLPIPGPIYNPDQHKKAL